MTQLIDNDAVDSGQSDLTVVDEAAKLIGHSDTPELAIGSILRLMSQMLGLNRGRVLLPSPPSDTLTIHYSYGLTAAEKNRGSYGLEEGITGKVMASQRQAVIQDVDEEPDFLFRAVDRTTLPQGVVSYLAVPILDGNSAIGVLGAHRLRMRLRSFDADLVILRIMATFIAQIIKINNLIDERTEHLKQENEQLKGALQIQRTDHGVLGESSAVRDALSQVMRVADTSVTVLLNGESGTGKERFSQILHLNSRRKDKPFLAINCGAIPEHLLETELFGHERGAFTGANAQKLGKIELANSGTLFLDEIGDLNLELQSKLLRVLESKVIQRVGGVKDIPVDVRIVAATHKNLHEAVNRGSFRLDLFYRLNVFPVHLPPLRSREGDVRILARHFLLAANREYQRNAVFSPGVMERLMSFNWPGNIRQLENVVKRAVLINADGNVRVSDIETILHQESVIGTHLEAGQASKQENIGRDLGLLQNPSEPPGLDDYGPAPFTTNGRPYNRVRADEALSITDAMRRTNGNKTRAAALLGMSVRQFRYRLDKLGLGK